MSKENIISRILSDAQEEADKIIAAANARADAIVAAAEEKAAKERRETEKEVAERVADIRTRSQAAARLEGGKISLAAKRRVIDGVYKQALSRLVSLPKEEALALASSLLVAFADEGDEILLAKNYLYEKELAMLSVVEDKKLRIRADRALLDGGFLLIGEKTDKNLSYGALLAQDREENESRLAEELF